MLPIESHASEGLGTVTIEKGLSGFIILLDGEAGTSARLQKNWRKQVSYKHVIHFV